MSRVGVRGVLSNALYTAWSALLSLATIPLLVRTIGLEAYGIVGLLLSAQALIFALDLGLSAAINRFVARYQALEDLPSARNLIVSASPVYGAFALAIILMTSLVSPWVAESWLVLERLSIESVARSIAIMGVIIALRFWLTLYQSALIGAGRVDISSLVGLVSITAAQLGGVSLAVATGDVKVYLMWLLLCSAIHWCFLRHYAWRVLRHATPPHRGAEALKRVFRFALGMAGVSLTGMLLMQADRLVLSRVVSLDDFAAYTLCWSLASGLYMILTPAFNYLAPRFASIVAAREYARLAIEYRYCTRVFAALLLPSAVVGTLSASELILVFSGSPDVASSMHDSLVYLLAGTALNGIMHFPYALQLAHGKSNMALGINILLCVTFVPVLLFLVNLLGARGAALAWLLVNAVYVIVGLALTHRYLRGTPRLAAWVLRDLGPSLLLALVVLLPVAMLLRSTGVEPIVFLLGMGVTAAFCCLMALRLSAGLTIAAVGKWSLA